MFEEHHNQVMFKSFCLQNKKKLERKQEKVFFNMTGDKRCFMFVHFLSSSCHLGKSER